MRIAIEWSSEKQKPFAVEIDTLEELLVITRENGGQVIVKPWDNVDFDGSPIIEDGDGIEWGVEIYDDYRE